MSDYDWLSFEESRKFVHSLKLKNNYEWKVYCKSCKKPKNIPSSPNIVYKNKGWIGIPDWLGNGNMSNMSRSYLTYDECSKFAQKNNITKQTEWENFSKSGDRRKNIPSHPQRTYAEQWKGWGSFLRTDRVANQNKKFLSFDKARMIVHALKFQTQKEFRHAAKQGNLPDGITGAPWQIHKNEFTTWGDWLGTNRVANQQKTKHFLDWPQAKIEYRKLAKKYGLIGYTDWIQFSKNNAKLLKDLKLPTDPRHVYSKERIWRKMKSGDNIDN
jgi:hypothetical protein